MNGVTSTRFQNVTDRLETIFKILFFLYAALTFNCFTFGTPLISFVMWPAFLLGAALIVNRILHLPRYRTPYLWWLVALLAAGCLSVLLNYRYDFKLNVTYMVCWALYFLLLYIQPMDRTETDLKKELHLFATMFTLATELSVLVSLVMMAVRFSLRVEYPGGLLLGGFVDSRLYGLFTDPNAGAVCAAVSALFLVHAMRAYGKRWQRALCVIGTFGNLLYIALSDSRTGMVVLLVIGFLYTLCYLLRALHPRRFAPLLAFIGAVIIGLGCFSIPKLMKTTYNRGVAFVLSFSTNKDGDSTMTDEEKQEIIDSVTVDRHYDLSGDISNRRFSVWQSGLEIFTTKPLFGTSYCGFTPYAKESLPETYIVNNDHTDMITFDNEVINVLVSNGIVGIIPMLLFAILAVVCVLRSILQPRFDTDMTLCTAAVAVFAIAASAMFRTAIFYYNSYLANLFWTFLGILATLCFLQNRKKGDSHATD